VRGLGCTKGAAQSGKQLNSHTMQRGVRFPERERKLCSILLWVCARVWVCGQLIAAWGASYSATRAGEGVWSSHMQLQDRAVTRVSVC